MKGYTLIEILVVIAILALLASFIIPNYQIILTQLQLTTTTQEVVDILRHNEQKTVTEQEIYGVTLSAGATTIPQYKCADSSCATSTLQSTFILPTNIVIDQVNFSGATNIRFTKAGAPNVSGNLVLRDTSRNRRRKVDVRPSGAILMTGGEY